MFPISSSVKGDVSGPKALGGIQPLEANLFFSGLSWQGVTSCKPCASWFLMALGGSLHVLLLLQSVIQELNSKTSSLRATDTGQIV